jgi:hypothetical protein
MNRALLLELQRMRCTPSVTLLHSNEPGRVMSPEDVTFLSHMISDAARRLANVVDTPTQITVVDRLCSMLVDVTDQPTTAAIALFASPEHQAVVRLARPVRSRVVVDDTFATRDLVADLNRTAVYRVFTISDRKVRSFVGDRARLVEVIDASRPLLRAPEQSASSWTRAVAVAMRPMADDPIATVIAGVERTVREVRKVIAFDPIGTVPGNHDRTGWADLHTAVWPIVTDWLRTDRSRALDRLEIARGSHRFAGGIEEIWELAQDGRVELLVVEETHHVPARDRGGRLERAVDSGADTVMDDTVMDDAVDELIEIVLGMGGDAVLVNDGDLTDHDHVAAVLRY